MLLESRDLRDRCERFQPARMIAIAFRNPTAGTSRCRKFARTIRGRPTPDPPGPRPAPSRGACEPHRQVSFSCVRIVKRSIAPRPGRGTHCTRLVRDSPKRFTYPPAVDGVRLTGRTAGAIGTDNNSRGLRGPQYTKCARASAAGPRVAATPVMNGREAAKSVAACPQCAIDEPVHGGIQPCLCSSFIGPQPHGAGEC